MMLNAWALLSGGINLTVYAVKALVSITRLIPWMILTIIMGTNVLADIYPRREKKTSIVPQRMVDVAFLWVKKGLTTGLNIMATRASRPVKKPNHFESISRVLR